MDESPARVEQLATGHGCGASPRLGVEGLGFRVWGLGFRV